MNSSLGILWQACPGGARILRVFGDSPCPALPVQIEGFPVVEIGPYCFAEKPVRPGAQCTGTDTHEITGNFVEEVTLPDTVRTLHSAAFYNCRRLRRLRQDPCGGRVVKIDHIHKRPLFTQKSCFIVMLSLIHI